MKIININKISIFILILSFSTIACMDEQLIARTSRQNAQKITFLPSFKLNDVDKQLNYKNIAQKHEIYNQNNPCLHVPREIILKHILTPAQLQPLNTAIETISALHYCCKHFNKLPIKKLIKMHKHNYNKTEKSEAFKKLLTHMKAQDYLDYKYYTASVLITDLGRERPILKSFLAKEYNQNNPFLNLPLKTIPFILSYINPLKAFKAAKKLHRSCKHFHKVPLKSLTDFDIPTKKLEQEENNPK